MNNMILYKIEQIEQTISEIKSKILMSENYEQVLQHENKDLKVNQLDRDVLIRPTNNWDWSQIEYISKRLQVPLFCLIAIMGYSVRDSYLLFMDFWRYQGCKRTSEIAMDMGLSHRYAKDLSRKILKKTSFIVMNGNFNVLEEHFFIYLMSRTQSVLLLDWLPVLTDWLKFQRHPAVKKDINECINYISEKLNIN